ncbi:MAG: hypothetical protein R3Y32_05260 [Bacillota bacterium]
MKKESMVFDYTRYFRVQPFAAGGTIMRADNIVVDYDDVSINFQTNDGLSQYNVLIKQDLNEILEKIQTDIENGEEIIDISKWI